MEQKRKPKVFWVRPPDLEIPDAICIDAPPEVWQHRVTGHRIERQYQKDFIKVAEVIPGVFDVPLD